MINKAPQSNELQRDYLIDYGEKTPYDYTEENKTESSGTVSLKKKKKRQENIFVTLTWESTY